MLCFIQIRNFAIVDQLELEIDKGLTAMTGETGAGKSILLDALGLVLGDRADSAVVRQGEERAEISVGFDLTELPTAREWLHKHDLGNPDDDECLLRRIINADGRSRAYINGQSQTLSSLRQLGEQLVDIHGQHEHQSLLRKHAQREMLDAYAGLNPSLQKLKTSHKLWQQQWEQLQGLQQSAQDRQDRLELLRYQGEELETLALEDGEVESLDSEHQRLANAEQIITVTNAGIQRLYDAEERTAYALISQCIREVEDIRGEDPQRQALLELANSALVQVEEFANELRNYGESLEIDPSRLSWLDERIATLHELARKHHCSPQELPAKLHSIQSELKALEGDDQQLDALAEAVKQAFDDYQRQALVIRNRREKAASKLSKAVTKVMQELGMPEGLLEIMVRALPEGKTPAWGMDEIEFMVMPNPGQAAQPLAKIASGGELSRISLAIQVITAHSSRIPTLMFDEVDSGIGGSVAEIVGRQLRVLGDSHQVLCVTHLPQVAAQAHRHFYVDKQVAKNQTRTRITALEADARTREIARMLGGVEITPQTLAHANEMIAHTKNP